MAGGRLREVTVLGSNAELLPIHHTKQSQGSFLIHGSERSAQIVLGSVLAREFFSDRPAYRTGRDPCTHPHPVPDGIDRAVHPRRARRPRHRCRHRLVTEDHRQRPAGQHAVGLRTRRAGSVGLIGLAAGVVPAMRAARLDPADALQAE